jgi:hypothetical protein
LKSPLPARTTVEWVRFEHEQEPYGVFSYAANARATLPAERIEELNRMLAWFSDHLHAPDLLTIERFWFRAESAAHVAQEAHGDPSRSRHSNRGTSDNADPGQSEMGGPQPSGSTDLP